MGGGKREEKDRKKKREGKRTSLCEPFAHTSVDWKPVDLREKEKKQEKKKREGKEEGGTVRTREKKAL